MNRTEQSAPAALPLAAAAERLGISPDALRMRLRRGRVKGFKRGGRLFIEVNEQPNGPARAITGQGEHVASEPAARGEQGRTATPPPARPVPAETAPSSGPDELPGSGELPGQALPVVIEFQKVELSRLLCDNTRLNRRLDQLTEELRHVREMQQREQVLRQQDLALRHQVQATLDRLTERLSLAAPTTAPDPAYAYGLDGDAAESAEAQNANAEEFAEMLKEIGGALRELDSAPPGPPKAPAGGAGSSIPAVPPNGPDAPDAPDAPRDDESRLLEILGRMGPSAEDRRTAARIMTRLLGRRGSPGQHDPES